MVENWIIPCNIKFFDVTEHFKKSDKVVWKNSFTIKKGDNVYIYLGAPMGEIRYKCTVIEDSVDDSLLQENAYAIVTKESHNYFSKKTKYVQLQLVGEYPSKSLTLEKLKEHGLGQVQIQARVPRMLRLLLESADKELLMEVLNNGN